MKRLLWELVLLQGALAVVGSTHVAAGMIVSSQCGTALDPFKLVNVFENSKPHQSVKALGDTLAADICTYNHPVWFLRMSLPIVASHTWQNHDH